MWSLKRRLGREAGDGPGPVAVAPAETAEEVWVEIERLTEENRLAPTLEAERRLVHLRHLAGGRLVADPGPEPVHPHPDPGRLPEAAGLPEIAGADLTPELLRAGILRDGCLLVRGLIPREEAVTFAAEIERSFAERELALTGQPHDPRYYTESFPNERYELGLTRPWVRQGGGVLAADAPGPSFQMIEMFQRAGIQRLVEGYLGEPGLGSVHKTTLRKAEPSVPGAWHQDGSFMGPVRALNLWLSLSRCGDAAPGLDVVPRRLEDFVTAGTDEALVDIQVSQRQVELAAAGRPILRPIFEPGDALLFDELFLHQTGSDPSMPNPRYAIEHWFFGPSAFPRAYEPLAV